MKRLRWIILVLLFCASIINYIDRQSLSILARTIQNDLKMSELDYAHVVQMFLLAYMLSFLVAGWLTDRLGVRVSAILFIGWWSIANMCTGFVGSVRGLSMTRFLLGAGESGLYTVAPKIVGQMFPASERSLAVGIYSAGATVGATIAPPLIAAVTGAFGWRAVFFAGGVMGLLWILPCFLVSARVPAEPVKPTAPRTPTTWRDVLLCREAMLLLGVRLITDPVWQFLLYWFPKYTTDARGLSLAQVGRTTWTVYLAADIGGVVAGLVAGRLVQRGFRPADSNKWVMLICTAMIPSCAAIPFVHSNFALIALAGLVAFAAFGYMISVAALAVEVLPADRFGSTWGIVCAGSGLGGILFASVVGHLVTSYSYTPVFALMACLHPAAFVLIWLAAQGRRNEVVQEAGFEVVPVMAASES